MVKQTAFVVGATGYTGRAVVAALCAAGVEVHAHIRADSDRLEPWRAVFEAEGARVDTTPWEPEAMRAGVARIAPTVVFSLLGTTRSRARALGKRPAEHYMEVDYGLTAMVLRACEDFARAGEGQPRFVYLSAAGTKVDSRNPYYRARAAVERELMASGLRHVIARPSFITGPGRDDARPMERIGAAIGDSALALVGFLGARKVRERWRSTSNEALAGSLVRLGLAPLETSVVVESEDL